MVGLRGVGKTVLLDRVRDDAEATDIQTLRPMAELGPGPHRSGAIAEVLLFRADFLLRVDELLSPESAALVHSGFCRSGPARVAKQAIAYCSQ